LFWSGVAAAVQVMPLQNKSSNSDYATALKVIEEYKSSTPETVRSCIDVECFAKQRLNQSKN
jgi:hypothetical protein